jgi:hypothetical protein
VLDLGHHPPSDAFLTKEQLKEPEIHYPLDLWHCSKCDLVQLGYIVPPEILFCKDYPYETGVNSGGRRHFREMAESIIKLCDLKPDSFIVDIGGNDGTLLGFFHEHGYKVINVDPSDVKSKVDKINEFWNPDVAAYIKYKHEPANIITATNVLAHVNNLHGFMAAVDILLDQDGYFVVETPSLNALIENVEYDTVYHEHLSYFNSKSIRKLVSLYNMELWRCDSLRNIHGGTTRYYIRKV